MGRQYDELNLTASDYTVLIDITRSHRSEFEDLYSDRLRIEDELCDRHPRGLLFKQYIEGKMNVDGVDIARIDLVFDNKKIINLLEARGNAIKTENFNAVEEWEN